LSLFRGEQREPEKSRILPMTDSGKRLSLPVGNERGVA
jgi:hypothetical protein